MADSGPPDGAGPALVLSGGGARAAYQVGLLRCLARHRPDIRFPILTGVSAGAINVALLASHRGSFAEAVDRLTELWLELTPEKVFRVDPVSLAGRIGSWGTRLVSGGRRGAGGIQGLVDTAPLRRFLERSLRCVDSRLPGIAENLQEGRLQAAAMTTVNYSTGQSITWVQGCQIPTWERPMRRSTNTYLTVDHVMASAALPLFFPAVRLGNAWHGDGGIRLLAPLSPAVHLGADRILAVSTRYDPPIEEADRPKSPGPPPPAQILGTLLNALFLDALDHDAQRLERINGLVEGLPPADERPFRAIRLLVQRPSADLGRLAADYEPRLPRVFRFLLRGWGTRETRSPDLLSLLMFQPDYIRRLIEMGQADAEARKDEIGELLNEGPP